MKKNAIRWGLLLASITSAAPAQVVAEFPEPEPETAEIEEEREAKEMSGSFGSD